MLEQEAWEVLGHSKLVAPSLALVQLVAPSLVLEQWAVEVDSPMAWLQVRETFLAPQLLQLPEWPSVELALAKTVLRLVALQHSVRIVQPLEACQECLQQVLVRAPLTSSTLELLLSSEPLAVEQEASKRALPLELVEDL